MRRLAIALATTCATACGSKSIVERHHHEPRVEIVVTVEGMTAAALEPDAMLVERAVIGLSGVSHVETQVTSGQIVVSAAVSADGDRFTAVHGAHESVAGIRAQLSDQASFPEVRWRGHRRVVLRYVIRSDYARADVARWSNVPRQAAMMVNGVVDVDTCGAGEPMLLFDVDLAHVAAFGLASSDVLDDLDNLTILPGHAPDAQLHGGPVRISYVATTNHTWRPPECAAASALGPAIVGTVYTEAEGDADMLAVREAVEQRLHDITAPAGVLLKVLPRIQPIELQLGAAGAFDTVAADISKQLQTITKIQYFVALRETPTAPITVHLIPTGRDDVSDAEEAARATLAGRFKVRPRNQLEVRIYGPDLGTDVRLRTDLATQLGDHVLGLRGGNEIQVTRIVPDRDAAARLGTSIRDVMRVYAALAEPGSLTGAPVSHDEAVYVHLDGDISLATVRAGSAAVPLSQVARFEHDFEPSEILREDGQRYVGLETDASEADLRKALAALKLPPGVFAKLVAVER